MGQRGAFYEILLQNKPVSPVVHPWENNPSSVHDGDACKKKNPCCEAEGQVQMLDQDSVASLMAWDAARLPALWTMDLRGGDQEVFEVRFAPSKLPPLLS